MFNLKLLKVNISFITWNDFRRLCSFVCICLYLLKHNYRCFLILVQSLSACTFSRIVDCFHECKLSSVWSYIFLLNGPDKKPKQNNTHSNKKPKKFANEPPSANEIFFWRSVTGTLRWLASLNYLLYFLAFDWLRPAVLFFLNWTVCLYL